MFILQVMKNSTDHKKRVRVRVTITHEPVPVRVANLNLSILRIFVEVVPVFHFLQMPCLRYQICPVLL